MFIGVSNIAVGYQNSTIEKTEIVREMETTFVRSVSNVTTSTVPVLGKPADAYRKDCFSCLATKQQLRRNLNDCLLLKIISNVYIREEH